MNKLTSQLRAMFRIIRLSRLGRLLFGLEYRRSRENVEIDITYLCNLKCHNCNRSLGEGQAPSRDRMSVAQVRQFLEESVQAEAAYKRLCIIGGEPTLHPQFAEIVALVIAYRGKFWKNAKVVVKTNGYGSKVKQALRNIPPGVDKISNTSKASSVQPKHVAFNNAPLDSFLFRSVDFANGCWITEKCGMGVTPYGYYPCAVAGSIDRVFGFDLGRKKLPAQSDDMLAELRKFCALCGHFNREANKQNDPKISRTWRYAYDNARLKPASLSRLPEMEEHPASPLALINKNKLNGVQAG